MSAVAHIQRTAPGPPKAIATGTPMILEAPIVEASAVVAAAKGDTEPSPSIFLSMEPKVCLMI